MSVLFAKRPQVGPHKLNPLGAGRLSILEERGNPLAIGMKEGETMTSYALFEVLMVAVLNSVELVELDDGDDGEWKKAVKVFSMDIDDDMVQDFNKVFEAEIAAIDAAKVEPIDDEKKSRGKKKIAKRRATPRRG